VGEESPVPQTVHDCAAAEAGCEELAAVNEPTLKGGDPRNLGVTPASNVFGSPN
jgi:hypothetical protein